MFSYGDLELLNPVDMFPLSEIESFDSKGDVTLIGNAGCMFSDAKHFNSDLSRWNVGNVTNTKAMFIYVDSFNSDLSNWNIKKVRVKRQILYGATSSFNLDLSWLECENDEDTSCEDSEDMSFMF